METPYTVWPPDDSEARERIFWRPEKETLYRHFTKSHYSHGYAGYCFSTTVDVYFIDITGKKVFCSFKINKDNKVSIKTKEGIKIFNATDFKFKKTVKKSSYWGQGGGVSQDITYTVIQKEPTLPMLERIKKVFNLINKKQ